MKELKLFPPVKAINNFLEEISSLPDAVQKRKIKYVFDFACDFYKVIGKGEKGINLPEPILIRQRAFNFTKSVIRSKMLDDVYSTFKQAEKMSIA